MSSSLATLREGTGELGASSTVLAGPHQSQATLPDLPHPTTTTTGHHTLSLPLHLSSRELGGIAYCIENHHDIVRFLCILQIVVIVALSLILVHFPFNYFFFLYHFGGQNACRHSAPLLWHSLDIVCNSFPYIFLLDNDSGDDYSEPHFVPLNT